MAVNKDIPVQIHPSMPMDQIVAAINQNFASISSNLTTYVLSDGNNNRIIFGKLPDGTYGLVISKAGYDVISLFQ